MGEPVVVTWCGEQGLFLTPSLYDKSKNLHTEWDTKGVERKTQGKVTMILAIVIWDEKSDSSPHTRTLSFLLKGRQILNAGWGSDLGSWDM